MYVGKKYTATVTKGFELEYTCKHCGFKSDATVVGVGQGQGNSPYFLDKEGARARASSSASSDAWHNAELTLRLCPCPKCRKRDASGFLIRSAFALVGSAGLLWGAGALIASIKGRTDDALLWIFGTLGVITPVLIFYTTIQWKWTTAEQRVVFHAISGKPRPRKRADDDDGEARREGSREVADGEEEREEQDEQDERAPRRRRRRGAE